jgi:hypothetical protein
MIQLQLFGADQDILFTTATELEFAKSHPKYRKYFEHNPSFVVIEIPERKPKASGEIDDVHRYLSSEFEIAIARLGSRPPASGIRMVHVYHTACELLYTIQMLQAYDWQETAKVAVLMERGKMGPKQALMERWRITELFYFFLLNNEQRTEMFHLKYAQCKLNKMLHETPGFEEAWHSLTEHAQIVSHDSLRQYGNETAQKGLWTCVSVDHKHYIAVEPNIMDITSNARTR